MKILYLGREIPFPDGYAVRTTGNNNPLIGRGLTVYLYRETSGTGVYRTIDAIEVCTFALGYGAGRLQEALKKAKEEGAEVFDLDAWLSDKVAALTEEQKRSIQNSFVK